MVSIEPINYVSGVDDEKFLVDQFEDLLQRSVTSGQPFLAVICFHGVHIPYVATPETRTSYPDTMSENEKDYWGTITQIDAQVGRIRSLLRAHQIENNTWVSITADNGPEVNPAGGQGTGSFANPGLTGGHRGRKRDVTEGGTRVIGLVEYPPAVPAKSGGRVEPGFPIVTMDVLPSVLDILEMEVPNVDGRGRQRSLDGTSLLPVLRGDVTERPKQAGIGIHGIFRFGSTNHHIDPQTHVETYPDICPTHSDAVDLGDVPANFSTPGNQPQFSWAEGNHLKLFGCNGHCDGTNCNSTAPGYRNMGWHFFLFNLTSDPAETTDLWKAQRDIARAMFTRFEAWQTDVWRSMGPEENGCDHSPSPPPPGPPLPVDAVQGMQQVQERCSDAGGNHIATKSGRSVNECAWHCKDATSTIVKSAGFRSSEPCKFFSYSSGCDECWLYAGCDKPRAHPSRGSHWVYNWSTYAMVE